MDLRHASIVGLLIVGAAQAAAAQQQAPVDVSRLPIDLSKITRELRQTPGTESHTALHIRYTIDVYGSAPRLSLYTKDDNLVSGPVPYGAPSHRDMLNEMTPVEFRAPVMDFNALLRWLTDKASKK
jgi:hypothetical protein